MQCTIIVLSIYGLMSQVVVPLIEYSLKASENSKIEIFESKNLTSNNELDAYLSNFIQNISEPSAKESNSEEYYCMRKKPQFSESEYKDLFQFKDYQPCKIETDDRIEIINDTVFAVCGNSLTPQYFFDPGEPEKIANKRISPKWSFSNRKIGSSQFVIINCGSKSIYTRVSLKYKDLAANNAQKIRNSINPDSKPFTVAILIIDSLSELSTQKNLIETWSYLNNDLKAYRFKYAKSFRYTTRDNMIPALYGLALNDQKDLIKDANIKNPNTYPIYKKVQEDHAIWSYFRSLGYITMFGYDSAFDFLGESLGTDVLTDHKFFNFYKTTQSLYRFNDLTQGQRCAGDQGGDKPMLDYTVKFYSTYNGLLKFGYTHISPAHEDTGNIRTADKDLLEFLKEFNKTYTENHEDFVLFFMGDHGRMNNLLRFDNRGYLEAFNPVMFIITSEKFKNNPILAKNTDRLIGRFDLYLTFKDLAKLPYGGMSDEEYGKLKNSFSAKDVVSLFREEIKANRTCEDIGSSSQKCSCDTFKKIDLSIPLQKEILLEIIKTINNEISEKSPQNTNCMKPELLTIINAENYEIRELSEQLESIYKLEYKLKKNTIIDAEVYFWFDKSDIFLTQFVNLSKKPLKKIFPTGLSANILLWNITISGPCQDSNCVC